MNFTMLNMVQGYTLQLSEAEAVKRHALSQTIRADFGFLMQKIDETSIEINFSRFSMNDYQSFVHRTRAIQQALITSYSSLKGVDKRDTDLFKEKFLPATTNSFVRLRAGMWAIYSKQSRHPCLFSPPADH
jgi:hypothetical protein